MIFHSSIKQSGEFVCCCSNYPAPFQYKNSKKELVHLAGNSRSPQYIKIKIEPEDMIFATCRHYSDLISANMSKYAEIINKSHTFPLDSIMDILVKNLNGTHKRGDKNDGEDKLLILIAVRGEN
jgi:N-acyl-D-aspartate/D-glutamate deacylase